jgi:hypothetical protein
MNKPIKAIAAISFCMITISAASSLAADNGEDRNRDGKPDRWIESRTGGGQIIKSDNNFDGEIDYILELDSSSNKIYEEMDFNLDGQMDDFYFYRTGVLERQEIDTNYDTKPDVWIYLNKGIYVNKVERDKDFDGVVDYTKTYK